MGYYKIFKVSKNKSIPLDYLYYGQDCAERFCNAHLGLLNDEFTHFDILCKPKRDGKWFRCSQVWNKKEPFVVSDHKELSFEFDTKI